MAAPARIAVLRAGVQGQRIDLEVLPHLTADDLKEIGVHAVGHRRKILDAISLLPADETAARAPGSPERRQLTIMFIDLVGSVDLSRKLDPEELREVMRSYQNAVAGEIARFDGHVAKFLGDGVLAYFGWPQASEDAAERAIRAGLAVAAAVVRMSAGGAQLAARIGIATGLVVVGDLLGEGAAKEEAVTGETPNLAARLQQVAEPGAVVIAESTRRLVGDLFELVGLGALPAERVRNADAGVARDRRRPGRKQVRGVARRSCHAARRARRGTRSDAVTLATGGGRRRAGPPDFRRARDREIPTGARAPRAAGCNSISFVSYACSPHHLNSPLFPFITQLEREAQFAPGDAPEERLKRLESLRCRERRDAVRGCSSALRRSAGNSERDARPRRTCLHSKGSPFSSGRSSPGSIDLLRMDPC